MQELTWDIPNNVSLLVYELIFFPWDNTIRQGEQMREEMRVQGNEGWGWSEGRRTKTLINLHEMELAAGSKKRQSF